MNQVIDNIIATFPQCLEPYISDESRKSICEITLPEKTIELCSYSDKQELFLVLLLLYKRILQSIKYKKHFRDVFDINKNKLDFVEDKPISINNGDTIPNKSNLFLGLNFDQDPGEVEIKFNYCSVKIRSVNNKIRFNFPITLPNLFYCRITIHWTNKDAKCEMISGYSQLYNDLFCDDKKYEVPFIHDIKLLYGSGTCIPLE